MNRPIKNKEIKLETQNVSTKKSLHQDGFSGVPKHIKKLSQSSTNSSRTER